MAKEARRGCGYRKVGGLYMVSGGLSAPCGRLPIELHVCPVCQAGIKQTRAWQWVKPRQLLAETAPCAPMSLCGHCPLAPANLPEKAGLIWIGEKFYPTARDFMDEAHRLGVSRRIPAIPRNFKLGETWVLIGHPKAVQLSSSDPRVTPEEKQALAETNAILSNAGEPLRLIVERKGIITMFKPTAIEKIVTETEAKDETAMAALREKGITPVAVPDDDADHQGTAYDKEDDNGGQAELQL